MDVNRLKSRYRGSVASGYEERRKETEKWKREQEAVTAFVERISKTDPESVFLDVPVGTGRFFDLYEENSVEAIGVDISEDMLEEARGKLSDQSSKISLQTGDIMNLSALDVDPDVVVCIRFMNWLEFEDVQRALESISKTGTENVIVGIRVRDSYKHRLGNAARTAYYRVTGVEETKTTIHDWRRLRAYLAESGFEIEEKRRVDTSTYGDKYIFWLTV